MSSIAPMAQIAKTAVVAVVVGWSFSMFWFFISFIRLLQIIHTKSHRSSSWDGAIPSYQLWGHWRVARGGTSLQEEIWHHLSVQTGWYLVCRWIQSWHCVHQKCGHCTVSSQRQPVAILGWWSLALWWHQSPVQFLVLTLRGSSYMTSSLYWVFVVVLSSCYHFWLTPLWF